MSAIRTLRRESLAALFLLPAGDQGQLNLRLRGQRREQQQDQAPDHRTGPSGSAYRCSCPEAVRSAYSTPLAIAST